MPGTRAAATSPDSSAVSTGAKAVAAAGDGVGPSSSRTRRKAWVARRAVPRRDRPLALWNRTTRFSGRSRAERLEGLVARGLRLGAGGLGGLMVERVLDVTRSGVRRRGLAVGGERLLVLAAPLQDVPLDRQQVGPARGLGEGLGDSAGRLLALLLAQGRDGEVGLRERIVRHQPGQAGGRSRRPRPAARSRAGPGPGCAGRQPGPESGPGRRGGRTREGAGGGGAWRDCSGGGAIPSQPRQGRHSSSPGREPWDWVGGRGNIPLPRNPAWRDPAAPDPGPPPQNRRGSILPPQNPGLAPWAGECRPWRGWDVED